MGTSSHPITSLDSPIFHSKRHKLFVKNPDSKMESCEHVDVIESSHLRLGPAMHHHHASCRRRCNMLANIITNVYVLLITGILVSHNLVTAGYVKEFRCTPPSTPGYYRTFHIDASRDILWVGGMDSIYRLPLANINSTHCEWDSIKLEPTNLGQCISKGKSAGYDCRNHIKVIQSVSVPLTEQTSSSTGQLYVCGTNGHNPRDYIISTGVDSRGNERSRMQLVDKAIPGIGPAIAKCPFDPDDNSTAVWVENGNPNGVPALYSGSVAEFTKSDTVLFRSDLFNTTSGEKLHPFKRTVKYDTKWLDKPNFVGSFEVGEYVYFFFRENAVEYINCGKSIYSRVARVCKNDSGGKNIMQKNWATFLKARLECSIPGSVPFHFNEIQDVYMHPNDSRHFYAVFSTPGTGFSGSAICAYDLEAVSEVFAGKFKEQATSSSAWLPVLSSKVPEPRPGTCVNDTQSLPDPVLNFARAHPLMDSAVAPVGEATLYHQSRVQFTKLAVDFVQVGTFQYTVYFAGTLGGEVFKVVSWYDPRSGKHHTNLVDVLEAGFGPSYGLNQQPSAGIVTGTGPETKSSQIRALTVSRNHGSLYVGTDETVRQVDLYKACEQRHSSCLTCKSDPYCAWDTSQGKCRPFGLAQDSINPYLIQDVTNTLPNVCDISGRTPEPVRTHYGGSVHLKCPIRSSLMGATSSEITMPTNGAISWYFTAQDVKHGSVSGNVVIPQQVEIEPNTSPKYLFTQQAEAGLLVMSTSQAEAGRYECRWRDRLVKSYQVIVDSKTCSTPSEAEYRRLYADWCTRYETLKQQLATWQTANAKCPSSQTQPAQYQRIPTNG